MATPELTIAKAALSASLFRADPASISRPSVDTFFQQVTSTLTQCSRPNVQVCTKPPFEKFFVPALVHAKIVSLEIAIQTCKDYILSNIIHSSGRSTALAKYLVALSNAQVDDAAHPRPSTKRRRLHVLYIVNDVLYHAARQGNQDFRTTVEAYLPPLISAAASFEKCPKHIKKLQNLVSIWKSKQYTSDAVIPKLEEALAGSTVSATPEPVNTSLKLAKEAPFILPSFHGDTSTAWYDLPAATWLPHLVPNSTKPMLPDLIRPIQLAPGPADNVVTAAVKALLSDAERIFSRDRRPDDAHIDVNEMGERIVLDEITGEVIGGETQTKRSIRVSIFSAQLFAQPPLFITILQTQAHVTFQKPQPQPQPQQKLHTPISLALALTLAITVTNPQPPQILQQQSPSRLSETISPANRQPQYAIQHAHTSPTGRIHRSLAATASSPPSTRLGARSCLCSSDDGCVERASSPATSTNSPSPSTI
ncbi:uncharacterized protein G6M90_00g019990 [Metarhizium brunneum]|uniref:CID domain-containing protein n=1 Tax=Metarhizium brunneum TaxID=500148 RepID=A0A7D5URU9_9HYPO|nr:hypothetical protein G6M90_00g019990 [Metarhizium brunneum]